MIFECVIKITTVSHVFDETVYRETGNKRNEQLLRKIFACVASISRNVSRDSIKILEAAVVFTLQTRIVDELIDFWLAKHATVKGQL
jgi:hypothetical protein